MSKKSRRRQAKRRAVKYISNRDDCSYAVAAFKINCMSTEGRKRLINRFKESICPE